MRNRFVFVADLAGITIATLGAFVLRFDWRFFRDREEVAAYLVAALLIKPAIFHAFGLYRRYWRYASVQDLNAVALAVLTTSAAMGVFVGIALSLNLLGGFSRAVIVIDGGLTLFAASGIRLAVRELAESRAKTRDRRRRGSRKGGARTRQVLVAGAGDAGTMVVREMQRNPQLGMEPVGFLDDDPVKQGKHICGVPVLGDTRSLERMRPVDEVVIAMPTATGAAVRALVESCQALGLKFHTMPGVFELLDGKVSVSRLRNVEIADLLRRRQVVARADLVSYVKGRTVLITGAGGSIGSELCRQVAHLGPTRLVMLGHGENSLFEAWHELGQLYPQVPTSVAVADIRSRRRLEQVFTQFNPEIIFHAAACKHVPLMEENFEEAISNNVVGTMNLVDVALERGIERFVSISTDKAVFPHSIMGASKRMADILVKDAARRGKRSFVVVRFGNVLGSRGSVVPSFKRQIERGGPVTITHPDMKRFFMTIAEAAHLVLQAGGIGTGGELFVLNMGEPVRIMDLATDLIHLSGFTTEQIPIVVTGIRPGEKLEESLWEDHALVAPTDHPDVLMVTEAPTRVGDVRAAVESLKEAAREGDRVTVEAILCDWIPTFTPSGSTAPGSPALRRGSTSLARHLRRE